MRALTIVAQRIRSLRIVGIAVLFGVVGVLVAVMAIGVYGYNVLTHTQDISAGIPERTRTNITASGDLNGDGADETVAFFTQETESGTRYYFGAVRTEEGEEIRTNMIVLGDDIIPEDIEIRLGVAEAQYAPDAADPSHVVARYAHLEDGVFRGRSKPLSW